MLYLYAAGPAFHSLGIRANARVRFPRAKMAPGGQTKPNGCIVFLVQVSCSGQRRCSAGVWGFRFISWISLSALLSGTYCNAHTCLTRQTHLYTWHTFFMVLHFVYMQLSGNWTCVSQDIALVVVGLWLSWLYIYTVDNLFFLATQPFVGSYVCTIVT